MPSQPSSKPKAPRLAPSQDSPPQADDSKSGILHHPAHRGSFTHPGITPKPSDGYLPTQPSHCSALCRVTMRPMDIDPSILRDRREQLSDKSFLAPRQAIAALFALGDPDEIVALMDDKPHDGGTTWQLSDACTEVCQSSLRTLRSRVGAGIVTSMGKSPWRPGGIQSMPWIRCRLPI